MTERRTLRNARPSGWTLVALALAGLAAVVVYALATQLFPYHSANHDEGVYLQQAATLLAGQLRLHPGPLVEGFRPWFFVRDGTTLYPKYAPVPAGIFAFGEALVGEFRASLAVVAAANVALAYAITAEAFDRRTGALAAAVLLASPLFLLSSAVFLPYAPTTALNLTFALAYVRAHRRGSVGDAALAGVAVGLAFFARPYTALLFALPFAVHALWTLHRSIGAPEFRPLVVRNAVTTALGIAFVGVTLAYNATTTGSPLLFPYEAFAPLDGIGFGRRRILGYERQYTPALALWANGHALWYLLTRWTAAGVVGSAFAALGVGLFLRRARTDGLGEGPAPTDHELRAVLAGLFVTVAGGNVLFWGTLNALGSVTDPADGLLGLLGPFYHFDLLLPLSAFAASGVLAAATALRRWVRARYSPRQASVVLLVVLALSVPAAGAAEYAVLERPVETNAAYTEKYEGAYEPLESTAFEDALVFLPTPYGPWQNHPFQHLRNDPGFDGPVVYALDRGPDDSFAAMDAYPDRRYYRYGYHGEWTADPTERVVPKLERIEVRSGETLRGGFRVAVPDSARGVSVRLSTGEGAARYAVDGTPGERLTVEWELDPERIRLAGEGVEPVGDGVLPVGDADEVAVAVTVVEAGGSTVTYRQETTVRTTGERVEAVWPPETFVCPLVTDCGSSGTYVPDRPALHPGEPELEVWLEASEGERSDSYANRSSRQTVTMEFAMA